MRIYRACPVAKLTGVKLRIYPVKLRIYPVKFQRNISSGVIFHQEQISQGYEEYGERKFGESFQVIKVKNMADR